MLRPCVAVIFLAVSALSAWAAENAALLAALNSITTDDLSRHVEILADDTFEGREAGSRGGRAAGAYLAKELSKFGLQPAGADGGWFQPFYNNQQNILARLPGSDAKLKDQVIIISAHYDHVGYGTSTNSFGPIGFIHNGADDNASGVSVLLEVMEAFQTLQAAPRRTILFVFWDGEEKGLLGSRYWLEHPTIKLENLAIAVNVDMVGRLRNKKVDVSGSRTSWGLRRLVSERAGGEDLLLDFNWELKSNSDHWPFYERGMPILMLHTGLHEDYHRPSDDPEKLNRAGMQQVARLLFRLALAIADADEIGKFRAAARQETPDGRRRLEQPLPLDPPRLGITWQENDDGPGLLISRVVGDSPADRLGLRAGDRLLKFNGEELADGARLRTLLVSAESPAVCEVRRAGATKSETLNVELAGAPTRVGISWRLDDAEPGSALLVRVIPGSPAHDAGLKIGDRIYKIGSESVRDSRQLAEKIANVDGEVTLTIERMGRIEQRTLNLTASTGVTLAPPSDATEAAAAGESRESAPENPPVPTAD